ncbi:methionyl-tRNA formyltransferase [Paenactinomyces guangxiensis]|uniref:Methionyl-tRNA formyltransferase n=1 Tax=Paenactinomyces guangxiensis TaxID=1490290 RepID=A0A7W1WQF9_9BACL|nr:methionyl-tRNA formyltransferase [Paenactinomyces guangxiensis]MBA4494187.1 methionyl-tRNA formyltransferase [Paenactinomyces guangxiensis]MBH8590683.1 methionyl-tRNA formyltransferase [Paenactinomyces guangxiensis]
MSDQVRIVFMGTPDFAVPSLRALVEEKYQVVAVVTQPDRPKGRKKELTPPPVKVAAQNYGIPVYQPEKLRDPEAIKKVLEYKPDLIVTAAYGQIVPEEILNVPRLGCINVHASLLPKYRGGAPIHKAIIDGEKETGITIMYMVKALDAGDMIAQRSVPITEQDHTGTMHDKLSRTGADLLKEVLPRLVKGEITAVPQDESKVTYAPNIRREDEKIDWSRSAKAIAQQVRGLHPWPVAFTLWKGKPFKVWWAEPLDEPAREVPGTVKRIGTDGIVVATGEGSLLLTEVQPAGKKRMAVEEFARGRQMEAGERLGDE